MSHEKWSADKHDASERCQTIMKSGWQCINVVIPKSKHCALHGGNKSLEAAEKQSLAMYRLSRYQKRMEEFRDHSEVKSLKNEIGILRMMLEEKLNVCKTNMELTLAAGPISDLVMKVEKLVSSCHRIDNQLGNLLDRHRVQTLASMLLKTVNDKINETTLSPAAKGDILDSVAEEFLKNLKETS